MGTPRNRTLDPGKIKMREPGTVKAAVIAAMKSVAHLPESDVSQRAEKYENFYYEYLRHVLTEPVAESEVSRRIEEIANLSAALLSTMRNLKGSAICTLNASAASVKFLDEFDTEAPAPTLGHIERRLEHLSKISADEHLRRKGPERKGPPKQLLERKIAWAAARDYVALSGQQGPNRSQKRGGFGAFLADVFTALDVKASVDDRAREVCEKFGTKAASVRPHIPRESNFTTSLTPLRSSPSSIRDAHCKSRRVPADGEEM
jgi:hypothetical protein